MSFSDMIGPCQAGEEHGQIAGVSTPRFQQSEAPGKEGCRSAQVERGIMKGMHVANTARLYGDEKRYDKKF